MRETRYVREREVKLEIFVRVFRFVRIKRIKRCRQRTSAFDSPANIGEYRRSDLQTKADQEWNLEEH